jgi:hypothetical protein
MHDVYMHDVYIYICTIVWISFSPLSSRKFPFTYVSQVTYIMHLLVELQVLTCFQGVKLQVSTRNPRVLCLEGSTVVVYTVHS